jgi:hypothetical protein
VIQKTYDEEIAAADAVYIAELRRMQGSAVIRDRAALGLSHSADYLEKPRLEFPLSEKETWFFNTYGGGAPAPAGKSIVLAGWIDNYFKNMIDGGPEYMAQLRAKEEEREQSIVAAVAEERQQRLGAKIEELLKSGVLAADVVAQANDFLDKEASALHAQGAELSADVMAAAAAERLFHEGEVPVLHPARPAKGKERPADRTAQRAARIGILGAGAGAATDGEDAEEGGGAASAGAGAGGGGAAASGSKKRSRGQKGPTGKQLEAYLRHVGRSHTGTKETMLSRIRAYLATDNNRDYTVEEAAAEVLDFHANLASYDDDEDERIVAARQMAAAESAAGAGGASAASGGPSGGARARSRDDDDDDESVRSEGQNRADELAARYESAVYGADDYDDDDDGGGGDGLAEDDVVKLTGEWEAASMWGIYTDALLSGGARADSTRMKALANLKATIASVMTECDEFVPPLPVRAEKWRQALNAVIDATTGVHEREKCLPAPWPMPPAYSSGPRAYKGGRGLNMISPDPMLFDGVSAAIRAARVTNA